MTGDEFKTGLKAIGWKQSDFARKVDTHKNTVTRWAANGPPTWAAEYLGVLLGLKDLNERFLAVPPLRDSDKEQQPPAGRIQAKRPSEVQEHDTGPHHNATKGVLRNG